MVFGFLLSSAIGCRHENPSHSAVNSGPKSDNPKISVEHFAHIEALAVQLLSSLESDAFYYTTFDGKVFKLVSKGNALKSELILGPDNHGITHLQGATLYH